MLALPSPTRCNRMRLVFGRAAARLSERVAARLPLVLMGLKLRWVLIAGLAVAFGVATPGCSDPEHDSGASGKGGAAGAGTGSGGNGTGTGGNSNGTAVDDFRSALWQAFCARLFRCPLANDDDIGIVVTLGTEQRCAEMIEQIQDRSPRELALRADLASGAVGFVSDKVSACLAEARSCAFANHAYNLTRSGPACRAVFEGDVPVGGACERSQECAGDARCVVDVSCPGRCAPRAAPGEPCDGTPDCDESAGYVECRFADGAAQSTCALVSIAPPAAEGKPCRAPFADAQTVAVCAEGLWCDIPATDSTGMGTCRAPLAAGAACDDIDDLCVDGYTCFDRTSCKPSMIGSKAGDVCDAEAGPFCDPFARLSCVSGKCAVSGDGKVGSACSTSDIHELLDCDPGLRCAGNGAGTCAPLLKVDEACENNSDCASGSCASGKCAQEFCEP